MPKDQNTPLNHQVVTCQNDIEIIKNLFYRFMFPHQVKMALSRYEPKDFLSIMNAYLAICEAPARFWWIIQRHDVIKKSLRLNCCRIIYQKGYFQYAGGVTESQKNCFRLIYSYSSTKLAELNQVLETLETLPLTSHHYPLPFLLTLLQHRMPARFFNATLTILMREDLTPTEKEVFLRELPHSRYLRSVMQLCESENLQELFPKPYFEKSIMALCRSHHPEYMVSVILMVSPMLFQRARLFERDMQTYLNVIQHSEQIYLYRLLDRISERHWLDTDNFLTCLDCLLNASVRLEELVKCYHVLEKVGLMSLPNLMKACGCGDLVKVKESLILLHQSNLNNDVLQYFYDTLIHQRFPIIQRQRFLLNLKKIKGKLWMDVSEPQVMFDRILRYVDSPEDKNDIIDKRLSPIPDPAGFYLNAHF